MDLVLNSKEIESVIKLEARKRYKYFLNRAADNALVWGLYDTGWVVATDEQDNSLFPVWPAKEYAQLCSQENWEGAFPKSIEIHEFMEDFLKNIIRNCMLVAVFYTPAEKGIILDPKVLYDDLFKALSRIE
jgi:hypothetical protein